VDVGDGFAGTCLTRFQHSSQCRACSVDGKVLLPFIIIEGCVGVGGGEGFGQLKVLRVGKGLEHDF
jgi:hypothetical protein